MFYFDAFEHSFFNFYNYSSVQLFIVDIKNEYGNENGVGPIHILSYLLLWCRFYINPEEVGIRSCSTYYFIIPFQFVAHAIITEVAAAKGDLSKALDGKCETVLAEWNVVIFRDRRKLLGNFLA